MNFNLSSPNFQDLEQIINALLSEGKCACHFINPNKTRILMWKERSPDSDSSSKESKDGRTIYHLRIGIQKFISQEQTDRNGETYWRYWNGELKTEVTKEETNHQPPTESDSITKFRQRQLKTEALNHDKSDNAEQSVHSSTS